MFTRFFVFLTLVSLACPHGLYPETQRSSQKPQSSSRFSST